MRLLLPLLLLCMLFVRPACAEQCDVLIYGATPAGIAAALAAATDGEKVILVEPTSRVGGLITNGLSHTDFRTFEGLTGAYLDFTRRVVQHYRGPFGDEAEKVSFRGTHAEPKANLAVFEKMLAEHPGITVWHRRALEGVRCSSAGSDEREPMRAVEIALFLDEMTGARHSVAARCFIDATYEGDLMAAVGVAYRVGREGREEYGETLAPEQPDAQLQGYNFRLIMTRDPANRVAPPAPPDYQRDDYLGVLPLLADGRIERLFGTKPKAIFKAQTPLLPNGKYDINDMSHGAVRLSLPGENDAWPDGEAGPMIRAGASAAISVPPFSRLGLALPRQRIFAAHVRWNVGLLHFLRTDEAVPERFRDEANEWGFCRDEFTENGGLPLQLYVREARRMVGRRVFIEKDTDYAPGDARAVLHREAIAMGDYGPNCHGTGHEGSRFGGRHTGEFYKPVAPYQIPYDVLVPREVENLLVPGAVSASHVGFCALRLEPIWMSLGQAAGHAARVARSAKTTLQRIPVARLQARLHQAGAATIYVSDVLPGHADFAAVQWWATAGGLHGLAPAPEKPGQRGRQIIGQYFEAFPGHAAELDRPLDPAVAEKWRRLAADLGVEESRLPAASASATRGEWIRAAWNGRKPPRP